jgi:hypothetical protein
LLKKPSIITTGSSNYKHDNKDTRRWITFVALDLKERKNIKLAFGQGSKDGRAFTPGTMVQQ